MGDKQLNHISLWLMDFVKGRGFDENHDSNKNYRILDFKWPIKSIYMDVTDVNLFENLCHLYEISFYAW